MRILYATFASGRDFLKSLKYNRRRNEASLAVRTRARHRPGERVILEVGFPGLPNRVLMRARALECRGRFPGQRFLLEADEEDNREFLSGVASESREPRVQRRHRRFPIKVPVRFFVNDDESYLRGDAETRDVTPAGVALTTYRLLPDDARVTVILDLDGGMTMEFEGQVTWSRRHDGRACVGIRFDKSNSRDKRRLRRLLRAVKLSGKTFEGALVADPEPPHIPQRMASGSGSITAPTAVAIGQPRSELAVGTPSRGSHVPDSFRALEARSSDDGGEGVMTVAIEMFADDADDEERTYLERSGVEPAPGRRES